MNTRRRTTKRCGGIISSIVVCKVQVRRHDQRRWPSSWVVDGSPLLFDPSLGRGGIRQPGFDRTLEIASNVDALASRFDLHGRDPVPRSLSRTRSRGLCTGSRKPCARRWNQRPPSPDPPAGTATNWGLAELINKLFERLNQHRVTAPTGRTARRAAPHTWRKFGR